MCAQRQVNPSPHPSFLLDPAEHSLTSVPAPFCLHQQAPTPSFTNRLLPSTLAPENRVPSGSCALQRQFIDYKTSMITGEDPLRGLLFYQALGFSHTLRALKGVRMYCQVEQVELNLLMRGNSPLL